MSYIADLIIVAFYLAVPAYFANMAPVIFAKLNWLNFFSGPIDQGRKMGGNFIFGSGKTWRGIIAAVMVSILVVGLQAWLYQYNFFHSISLFDYGEYLLIFGVLAGLGAILGDLVKSFFKRRINIKSGGTWPIFDQLDFIVGFFIAVYWLVRPEVVVIFMVVALTLVLHPLINLISYQLGIKKVWW